MKRVCISLAAALALAVPSFAQSAEETPFSCEVRTKYNQPGTPYSSLAEAVAAVPTDGKIHYVSVIGEGPAEITTPITVKAGQNISLYSEKSGITYDIPAALDAPVFTVKSGARLTFTRNGNYVYGEGVQGTFLENYGYVSIANGTFTLDAGESGVAIINHGGAEDNSMKCGATVTVASGTAFRNDGALTISSGTTTAESGIAVLSNGGTLTLSTSKSVIGSKGAIEVNGGVAKFEKGTLSSTGSAPAVLLCASNAPIDASFKYTTLTLTSTGGDALGIAGSAQVCKVQINKGTFAPAEGKDSIRVTHDTEDADITLSVVDGVFKAPIVSEGSASVGGFILGGTFAAQPDPSLVADGLTFEQNADGLYAPTAVAQIGDTTYSTFKEAIAAATAGDTVTLLRDVAIPESTPITVYGLTVDLDGHTLTNTATGGSGIRLTLADAEGTPANFTLVGPGSVVAATPLYASGAYNYARPYTVIVDESVILKSTVEGNPQIELSGSARVAATDANVTRLGQGGFKVKDGDAEWLYGTCAGAFLNTPEGGTFTLCQDFKGLSRLEFPIDPTLLQTRATGIVKSATLDLAGHAFTSTLDGTSADLIVVDSGANVTIKGGTLAAIGDLAHVALPPDGGNAALTLEGITATSSSDDYLIVSNGSTDNIDITVRNSTLTATGKNTVAIYAPAGGDSTVTLDNAVIKSPYGVQVCAGNLVVKGDTQITTTAANVASTKTGDGPIPDGAAISIVDRAGYGDDATTGSSIGTVTIEGTPTLIARGEGATAVDAYTWNDNTKSDWAEASEHVAISGGTFSQKPDDALLAPDFVLVKNQDGTFDVVSAYVASIGEKKYADFNSFFAAFKAIEGSEKPTTVTLLADLTGDRTVPGVVPVAAGQNIVFDLNGHTMETVLQQGSSTKHYYAIENSGTLTIKDSSTEQTGTIRARGVKNSAQGNLTVESGTLVAIDSDGGAALWNEGDAIVSGGKLLVEDLVGSLSAIRNEVKATLVVKGGEVQGQSRSAVSNVGTMTIEGGLLWNTQCNVTSDGKHKSPWYYAVLVAGNANASLKMTGGTIRGTQGALSFIGGKGELTGGRCETVPCIYHGDTGGNIWHALYLSTTEGPVDVTVGGDFVAQSNGREAFVIGGNNGDTQTYTCKATVTGGTFIGDEESGFAALRVNNQRKDGVEPIIQGGHFEGGIESVADTGFEPITNFVSGGTFSQAVPEAFCAPGYAPKQNADGTYSVVGWYETGVDTNDDGVADAWTIRNEGDLAAFRDKVNSTVTFAGCTVTLTADLDLSDMGTWIPIGEGNAGGASKNGGFFAGTFEGGNYLIANVTASETKVSEGSGLFGWVRGATIRDLNVSGWFSNTNGAAGLIGVVDAQGAYTTTTITNVHNVGGTVQGTARGSNAGGIIGEIRSGVVTITGCSNAAAVTASINHSDTAGVLCAGGIVGDANGASVTISDCSNTGAVTAYPDDEGNAAQTPVFAGGIVGRMGTGSIAAGNGDNTGTVSATGAGTAGQGAILGGVVAGTQPVLTLALTEADAEAGRVALFTAAEVVPEGLTVTVAPAEGASAPAGTVLAVDDGTLYCNLLYLANRVAGESEGETFNAAAQEALLAAAGNTLYGTIAVTGTTADDKALTTAQVNEVLACFEGEGLITASESEGVKTLVVAYDFGITGLRVTAKGDLVVTVAAQDAQAKPLAFAEGVTFALRNGDTPLEATAPTVADGVTTLTVPKADLPAGNLELTISVAPAAEAETPAE